MDDDRGARLVWWIAGILVLAIFAWRFVPKLPNPVAPKPLAAFVAIQAAGEKAASDGEHDLSSGTPFRLYAVLEARTWSGSRIWYTEAPALELAGQDVPASSLRRWPGSPIAKVRWFTVEGFAPYLHVAQPADLDRFRLDQNFHPEWGDGWSAKGVVDPNLAQLDPASPLRPLPFGVQRYEARVELFADPKALTPVARFQSPGPQAFLDADPAAPRVVARLNGPVALLSSYLGRVEIETDAGAPPTIDARVATLVERGLAFVHTHLIADHIDANGVTPGELVWRTIDVDREKLAWGTAASPGDLLQAGARIVVLFQDAGAPGKLDRADLVFDLEKGIHIRRIAEVFVGEGPLELSFAHLGR